jgi:hypothetical protein
MIRWTTEGVEKTATDEELRAARETFERDRLLRLPGLITEDLAEAVREGMQRDGFEQPDEATQKSVYGGWYGRVREDLNPGVTNDMLNARANDPVFLDFVRQIAGTPPLGQCVGRVFRLLPTEEDLPWHTDAEGGRVADLVVDLSDERYEGGRFEIRDAETQNIFTTVDDLQYREGTLAPISEKIEHHNLRVTSETPRVTFVGWFVPAEQE